MDLLWSDNGSVRAGFTRNRYDNQLRNAFERGVPPLKATTHHLRTAPERASKADRSTDPQKVATGSARRGAATVKVAERRGRLASRSRGLFVTGRRPVEMAL